MALLTTCIWSEWHLCILPMPGSCLISNNHQMCRSFIAQKVLCVSGLLGCCKFNIFSAATVFVQTIERELARLASKGKLKVKQDMKYSSIGWESLQLWNSLHFSFQAQFILAFTTTNFKGFSLFQKFSLKNRLIKKNPAKKFTSPGFEPEPPAW